MLKSVESVSFFLFFLHSFQVIFNASEYREYDYNWIEFDLSDKRL